MSNEEWVVVNRDQLSRRYRDLMDLSLEQQANNVEHNIPEGLRSTANRLGFLKAWPRDVVEIYRTARRGNIKGAPSQKGRAYAQEGYLALLELMGYPVSYYRDCSLGTMKDNDVSDASKSKGGGKNHDQVRAKAVYHGTNREF